jgi:DNA-binding CsgD family transcriptional regulator
MRSTLRVAMSTAGSTAQLYGRRSECAALDELVTSVRSGASRVLVLRGEAGVGKSALLEYLLQHATGCGFARATGVELEMELPYAGLQQLCAPFLDRLESLPGPQRNALGTAFALRAGGAPDRFTVGLAVLSLLSEVAEERPLICIVDDGQWLDEGSAQALAFVARRLGEEAVAMVFALREPSGDRQFNGLPELAVDGLDDRAALELLGTVLAGPIDEEVRDRIVAEARGNPLALLELPRLRPTLTELAGGFGLSDGRSLSRRIEQSFTERLAPLPPATRLLLLVAAAEPIGDPVLVWRAAAELGIGPDAAGPATGAELIDFGTQVRFSHPLVRSAVKAAASADERHRVHRALAAVTDAEADPDRRAWHLANATVGLDEEVAAELERSAGRARARGGLAAEAAFHERAVELTPDPTRRAQRALLAAKSKHRAGANETALRLLSVAQAGPLEELDRARAQLLHAQVTFAMTRGRDAPPLLLEAARRLERLDPTLARETYLEAFAAALSADRLAQGGMREVAAAVLSADWEHSKRARDLLLDGLARLTCEGYVAAAPALKVALRAFRDEQLSEEEELHWLWLASRIARALADDEAWDELTARHVELARRTGAFSLLPLALTDRMDVELVSGRFAAAISLAAEADAVVEATGSHLAQRTAIILANWRGRDAEATALIEAGQQEVLRRGEGLWVVANDWGSAQRYNGLGRYDEALAAAERAADDLRGLGQSIWVLTELIEAAVRSDQAERATGPASQLAERAHAADTDLALGAYARVAAMLADGAAAERLYREAIGRLSRIHTRNSERLARAHLVYGEWLRREHRRVDAREQLRVAHEMLTGMGADAFAERARRELQATGETARKRTVETLDDLTPQEAQVARLAADGQTNPEIGAQLFLSPRTVEWHLGKVFGKLGIGSRKELRSALSDIGASAVST